jgi:uncharacterized membrane protein
MNGVFLHLTLNHLPVLLPILGAIILFVGIVMKLQQTQVIGVAIVVFGALATIPTYLSGTSAKKIAQNYPLVTQGSVDRHEVAALYSFIAIEIVGVLGIWFLWQFGTNRKVSRENLMALLVLIVVASVLVSRTAHLGGLIRHEEIEQGSF